MAGSRHFWEFIFSPTLYKVYTDGRSQGVYEPNSFEKFAYVIDSVSILFRSAGNLNLFQTAFTKYSSELVSTSGNLHFFPWLLLPGVFHLLQFFFMWNVGLYTSPLVAAFFYKKGYFVFESLTFVTRLLIGIGVILSSSYCLRGLGRITNPTYTNFYEVLIAAKKALNPDTKKALSRYDFDFSGWPIEFKWDYGKYDHEHSRLYVDQPSTKGTAFDTILSLPCRILSFLAAHSFGIKLVYPGSIRALQYLRFNVILESREKLITDFAAERCKLRTQDGNDIDSIFIDRRGKFPTGDTLVICCEGNAGFYELGIAMTPIKANYSVLGWNHPGFGGSTGTPFPRQEQHAVDCVMQFAIHHLNFEQENIILFGWSIGGFTASWAAMNYPDIKGMILDATFDDILPLAIPRMPASWEPLVRRTIRDYINLNIYEQLSRYSGPVTFIRRTEDEIICTEQGNLSTNRVNHLVAKFLRYRYPKLIDEKRQNLLNEWLASDSLQQSLIRDRYKVDKDQCNALINNYVSDVWVTYPMEIGEDYSDELKSQMTLFLVDTYLKNYRSSHCTPLPVSLFRIPWSPGTNDSSFVKL